MANDEKPAELVCPACNKPRKQWSCSTHRLLQIMACTDVYAIYANDDGTLSTMPCDALGLAEETITTRRGHPGYNPDGCSHGTEEVDSESNQIVGLLLREGWYQIADDDDNFAGLCTGLQDPWDCLGQLNWPKNKEFDQASAAFRKARSPDE